MPTWRRSFRGAAAIVLFGILWWIVGLLILVFGLAVLGLGYVLPIVRGVSSLGLSSTVSLIGGIVLIVLGIAVMILGFLASYLKVTAEITAEEVESRIAHRLLPPAQAYAPPPPPPYQHPGR